MSTDQTHREIEAFFQSYKAGFEHRDPHALAGFFAYPIPSSADPAPPAVSAFATAQDYISAITPFLDSYRIAGVVSGDIMGLAVHAFSPRVARADLHWRIHD